MRILRAADAPRVRWRNDGGWTRELFREPADGDDFDWRISVAEVETDGPFSAFVGYDRVLLLLEGAGMDLHFTGDGDGTSTGSRSGSGTRATAALRPDARRLRFAGEAPITATLVDGPTTDFNLICRRAAWVGDAELTTVQTTVEFGGVGYAGAHVVTGSLTLLDGSRLYSGDTVISRQGERIHLAGNASMVAFALVPGVEERRLT